MVQASLTTLEVNAMFKILTPQHVCRYIFRMYKMYSGKFLPIAKPSKERQPEEQKKGINSTELRHLRRQSESIIKQGVRKNAS